MNIVLDPLDIELLSYSSLSVSSLLQCRNHELWIDLSFIIDICHKVFFAWRSEDVCLPELIFQGLYLSFSPDCMVISFMKTFQFFQGSLWLWDHVSAQIYLHTILEPFLKWIDWGMNLYYSREREWIMCSLEGDINIGHLIFSSIGCWVCLVWKGSLVFWIFVLVLLFPFWKLAFLIWS